MPTNRIREKINELHIFYVKTTRTAIIECESETKDAALSPLIKVRNGFDDIARMEAGLVDNDELEDLLKEARKHFERATTEAYELVIKHYLEIIDQIIKSFKPSFISSILNTFGERGTLYKRLISAQEDAVLGFSAAREIKNDNFQEGLKVYKGIIVKLRNGRDNFYEEISKIQAIEFLQHKELLRWILAILIGILSGIIIGFLLA